MVVFGGVSNGYRYIFVKLKITTFNNAYINIFNLLFYNSSNDIWCLNLDSYCWHKQTTSNFKPQPRYGQSQIELGEKHLLVLGKFSIIYKNI
jgi:hypothetical protein